MPPMPNIRVLLNNLRENNWHITAFTFGYNSFQYIVLFEDIANLPLVADRYIVLLTFIDQANGNRILQAKANEYSFNVQAKDFREYFHIRYAENLGDIFRQFYAYFGTFIPQVRPQMFDGQTTTAMVHKLNRNDNENMNNLCCYAARRNGIHNGIQYHRTPFNSDKTKLLRENLFNMLGDDNTISFCYREDHELSDLAICEQFERQYGIH